jgi:hypothetical protein
MLGFAVPAAGFIEVHPIWTGFTAAVFVDPISLSFWVSRSSSVSCGDNASGTELNQF